MFLIFQWYWGTPHQIIYYVNVCTWRSYVLWVDSYHSKNKNGVTLFMRILSLTAIIRLGKWYLQNKNFEAW